MRVLIGCEFSGVVRRAFRALGHDAWSCDLLPAEDGSEYHIQDNVLNLRVLNAGWDFGLFFTPCTFSCNSGVRWLKNPDGSINQARYKQMAEMCDLFAACYHSGIPHISMENPVMHKYAKDYLQVKHNIPPFTQSIQPWQFGHGETKRTCLWLRNLPLLVPTAIVAGRVGRLHRLPPGPTRAKERSRTYEGIALAMASQWSNLPDKGNFTVNS